MNTNFLIISGICLFVALIIWLARHFDPDTCSKCRGPMEMHIDGNLHCDNCGYKLKL